MKKDIILQKRTDIGLIREKNEDSVNVLTHTKDKDIKFLILADGMGGKDIGDVASKYVIRALTNWFNRLEVEEADDCSKVEKDIVKVIERVNKELIDKYGSNRLGTTLSLALVNHTKTLILNIGDSRCYIEKDGKLSQITEDQSKVWSYYKEGSALKEDLRYFSTSNFITSCIGLSEKLCNPVITYLDNEEYDLLLLLTDGVTDLLTDKKMEEIISTKNKKRILDKIIEEAVYVEQNLRVPLRLKRAFNETFFIPRHGKDNASGAIFIKSIV